MQPGPLRGGGGGGISPGPGLIGGLEHLSMPIWLWYACTALPFCATKMHKIALFSSIF